MKPTITRQARARRPIALCLGAALLLTACGADGPDVEPAAETAVDEGSVASDAALAASADVDGDVDLLAVPLMAEEVSLSRDPFDPVRQPPEEPVDETVSPTAGTSPETGPIGQPVFVPGEGATACRTDGDVVCDGISVALLDVTDRDGDEVAMVQADTTVLEVTEGMVFFERFRVLSIDGMCVSFVYGDEPFTLCKGEQTLK